VSGKTFCVEPGYRSLQEILDRAEELAERFETYDPVNVDEAPVEEYMSVRDAATNS
jgi:hypothetical protein